MARADTPLKTLHKPAASPGEETSRDPRDMARPLLSVENLRIEFPTRHGTLVAIDDASFHIDEGEILGVVGESGAGKSITGMSIIGLLDPPGRIAGGRIHLDGQRIDNLSYEKMRRIRGKKIGTIFQDPLTSLNPLYTIGRQLVETILTHSEMSPAKARERAVELLVEVGIPAAERRIDNYPHQFSGGMRQRVVIALALCANPRLIIADEPTTALDVSVQAQIISLLKVLSREHGTAVMLVTHDMGVIAETADRVAVMYAGRLAEIGPVQEVIQRPKHPYTVGLMGSIPADRSRRIERLVQIEGAMPRLTEIPAGCAFNPRCPKAFERCRVERPELVPVETLRGRQCWLLRPGAGGRQCLRPRPGKRRRQLARCAGWRYFDVSKPWLNRALEGERPRHHSRRSTGSASTSRAARPSRWWASRAAASRPWRAAWSGCTEPSAGCDPARRQSTWPGSRPGASPWRCAGVMQMIFQDPYASLNPRWRVRRRSSPSRSPRTA